MSITVHTGPNSSTTPPSAASLAARVGALSYGGVAYMIFVGTFLYAVGFVSQHLVPKDINAGPTSPMITALLTNLVLMSIFAVQHSGMARQGFKRLFMRFASPAIERSTYVLLASLLLLLLFCQWRPMPAPVWSNAPRTSAGIRRRPSPR